MPVYGAFNRSNYGSFKPLQPGPVATHFVVQPVFWGGYWSRPSGITADEVIDVLVKIVKGPYMAGLWQYGCRRGQVLTTPAFASGSPPSDSDPISKQMHTWVQDGFQGVSGLDVSIGSWFGAELDDPVDERNVVFALFSPPSGGTDSFNGVIREIPDAIATFPIIHELLRALSAVHFLHVKPGSSLDTLSPVLAHELVELVSDPDGTGEIKVSGIEVTEPGQSVAQQVADDVELSEKLSEFDRVHGVALPPYWHSNLGTFRTPGAARRSSSCVQGTWGRHGNFELAVGHAGYVQHLWRDNDTSGLPWRRGSCPPGGDGWTCISTALVEVPAADGRLRGNLTLLGRFSDDSGREADRLLVTTRGSSGWSSWSELQNAGSAIGVTGTPALLHSRFDLLLAIVPNGTTVRVYSISPAVTWPSTSAWNLAGEFPAASSNVVGVSALQGNFGNVGAGLPDSAGNVDLVGRVEVSDGSTELQFAWLKVPGTDLAVATPESWQPITVGDRPVIATGDVALWQSTYDNFGNYELLVPSGNHIYHYARLNDQQDKPWGYLRELQLPAGYTPRSIAAFQGSYAPNRDLPNNFEAFIRATPPNADRDQVLAAYFTREPLQWNLIGAISPDAGDPESDITGM